MEFLPRDQWSMRLLPDGVHVLEAIRAHQGYLVTEKRRLSDYPNEYATIDDLERLGVYEVDSRSVVQG